MFKDWLAQRRMADEPEEGDEEEVSPLEQPLFSKEFEELLQKKLAKVAELKLKTSSGEI